MPAGGDGLGGCLCIPWPPMPFGGPGLPGFFEPPIGPLGPLGPPNTGIGGGVAFVGGVPTIGGGDLSVGGVPTIGGGDLIEGGVPTIGGGCLLMGSPPDDPPNFGSPPFLRPNGDPGSGAGDFARAMGDDPRLVCRLTPPPGREFLSLSVL